MNGHASLSRQTGGATAWMKSGSTLSYARCGSSLTALITAALEMSDLGRQQKHPCVCAHIVRKKISQFTFHCLFTLPPSPLVTATYRIMSHCIWAGDTTHWNTYALHIYLYPLQATAILCNAHKHSQGHIFGMWGGGHQPYSVSRCLKSFKRHLTRVNSADGSPAQMFLKIHARNERAPDDSTHWQFINKTEFTLMILFNLKLTRPPLPEGSAESVISQTWRTVTTGDRRQS